MSGCAHEKPKDTDSSRSLSFRTLGRMLQTIREFLWVDSSTVEQVAVNHHMSVQFTLLPPLNSTASIEIILLTKVRQ